MSAAQPSALHHAASHAHAAGERCPWCDQAIPHEKFAEIRSRIAAREREQHAEMTARLKEEFAREKAATEARAREEGRKVAEAAIEARLAGAEAARSAAEAARIAAETALSAQLETLEKEKTLAVLAEQAKAFEERQKLQEKVAGLQKQLENKTAQELGETPEADLFEQLRTAFEGDRIRRVLKGAQGADVIHEIVHKSQVCGKIIYDSKNRNAWKSDFVTKLRADQMAERAEHAVLSSNKFPAGTQQLHTQDGVIIAHPARVVAVAEILRRHLVQTYELRISNEAREEKTAALYAFITSDRCRQLLDQMATQTGRMLELEAAEEKAHRLTWERRSKLIHGVRKVHGDLCFEIERVIGTGMGQNGPEDPGVEEQEP
jgi:hypothetical protein